MSFMMKPFAVLIAAAVLCGGNAHAAEPAAAPPSPYVDQITQYLLEQAAGWPGTPKITVEPFKDGRMAPCDSSEVFLPGAGKLRSRLTVGLRCLAPQSWVSYTQVSMSIEGSYYVTAYALKAGTVLSPDNLAERSGDLLRLPTGSVVEADRLIGSVTTQRLGAGSTIKYTALRSGDAVQRGQSVRLEARGPGFVATSEGKAMESGEPGTQIQVRAASGQIVSGTVLNAHTVVVAM